MSSERMQVDESSSSSSSSSSRRTRGKRERTPTENIATVCHVFALGGCNVETNDDVNDQYELICGNIGGTSKVTQMRNKEELRDNNVERIYKYYRKHSQPNLIPLDTERLSGYKLYLVGGFDETTPGFTNRTPTHMWLHLTRTSDSVPTLNIDKMSGRHLECNKKDIYTPPPCKYPYIGKFLLEDGVTEKQAIAIYKAYDMALNTEENVNNIAFTCP